MFFTDTAVFETFPFSTDFENSGFELIGSAVSYKLLIVFWFPEGKFIKKSSNTFEENLALATPFAKAIPDPTSPSTQIYRGKPGLILNNDGTYKDLINNPQTKTEISTNQLITIFKETDADPQTITYLAHSDIAFVNTINLNIPNSLNTIFKVPCVITSSKNEARLQTLEDDSITITNVNTTEDNLFVYVPIKNFNEIFGRGKGTEERAKKKYVNFIKKFGDSLFYFDTARDFERLRNPILVSSIFNSWSFNQNTISFTSGLNKFGEPHPLFENITNKAIKDGSTQLRVKSIQFFYNMVKFTVQVQRGGITQPPISENVFQATF